MEMHLITEGYGTVFAVLDYYKYILFIVAQIKVL